MTDENYWDLLMVDDFTASVYMAAYDEGVGSKTRMVLGEFINDGESVLDVGCGPGWNYDHFLKYGPEIGDYLGMDYSKRFVRVANVRNSGKYIHGDARHISQPDESWDVVILQDVLEHTNGYKDPVNEALRVARKRIIITFWRMNMTAGDVINDDGNDGWGASYSQKDWEAFLNSLKYVWHQYDYTSAYKHKRDYYIIEKEQA